MQIPLDNPQTIHLPYAARFDEHVTHVNVRVVGNERIISPANQVWDSFFLNGNTASEDFMEERETAVQPERDGLHSFKQNKANNPFSGCLNYPTPCK